MASGNTSTNAPRAIWIWEEDSYRMLDHDNAWQEVASFLSQHQISTLYLYADQYKDRNILVNEPDKYRKLITSAHQRGFKVFALLGSWYLNTPEYILPKKRTAAIQMFANVLTYNKNTQDTLSRFDGINIDIEPYLLDDWSTSRPVHGQQYLDLSSTFMRMKADSGLSLQVGPAMPFWYSGIEDVEWNKQHRTYNEYVQDIYDYVAIMDYRNVAEGSDSITSLVQEELDYADKTGKKVMIGVETLDTTPVKVTFYGKDNKYFEEQLALAQSSLSRHPSFSGFVIHNLNSYRKLVEGHHGALNPKKKKSE